jgi:hypothetical protein
MSTTTYTPIILPDSIFRVLSFNFGVNKAVACFCEGVVSSPDVENLGFEVGVLSSDAER